MSDAGPVVLGAIAAIAGGSATTLLAHRLSWSRERESRQDAKTFEMAKLEREALVDLQLRALQYRDAVTSLSGDRFAALESMATSRQQAELLSTRVSDEGFRGELDAFLQSGADAALAFIKGDEAEVLRLQDVFGRQYVAVLNRSGELIRGVPTPAAEVRRRLALESVSVNLFGIGIKASIEGAPEARDETSTPPIEPEGPTTRSV